MIGFVWRVLVHGPALGLSHDTLGMRSEQILMRIVVVTSGRNWEGISPDPYLSGALVFESVQGTQATGVITSTKVCCKNDSIARLHI